MINAHAKKELAEGTRRKIIFIYIYIIKLSNDNDWMLGETDFP
jgi:hypothetical protein